MDVREYYPWIFMQVKIEQSFIDIHGISMEVHVMDIYMIGKP